MESEEAEEGQVMRLAVPVPLIYVGATGPLIPKKAEILASDRPARQRGPATAKGGTRSATENNLLPVGGGERNILQER